jgi:predicted GNAT family N-acyltransferase
VTTESDADSTATTPDRTGVFVVDTDQERDDAFAVRQSVFVDEQGVDPGIEYDEHDEPGADATHFVAYAAGEPIGAARLRPVGEAASEEYVDGPVGKVERVAVATDKRGDGWGRRLMDAVEAHACNDGFERLTLHAQTHVRAFYDHLNYEAYGEEFEEAGIPHVAMQKALDSDA